MSSSTKMESKNDFQGYWDDESEGYLSDDDEGEDETASQQSEDPDFFNGLESNYTIMREEEISQRQDAAVSTITNFLSVSETEAGILLRSLKWSLSTINDTWFADEALVRQSVGLPTPSSENRKLPPQDLVNATNLPKQVKCPICLDIYSVSRMRAAPICDHFFCDTCWTGYIHNAIRDGPGCLTLRCPDPFCGIAVGEDMILAFADEEDLSKYQRYLLRSYVENNRKAKWCPAPGCDYAVEYSHSPPPGSHDVVCKCSHKFCWNCLEEAHRPVDCETVAKWIMKNSTEQLTKDRNVPVMSLERCSKCSWPDNIDWMLANRKPCPSCQRFESWILGNLKPCPKCKRPIEKNQGCMHMTCTPPCNFEFCWLCLDPWRNHSDATGGFYSCNRFDVSTNRAQGVVQKQKEEYDEDECRRDIKSSPQDRYRFYYERWAAHEVSSARALSDVQHVLNVQIEEIRGIYFQPTSQLEFVREAWLQIVQCRRILKWTYAYGFYLPDDGGPKRQYFNYLQGEAEASLQRLYQCAEIELHHFLNVREQQIKFNEFRTKLQDLTRVTRSQFQEIVRVLENGLEDFADSKALKVAVGNHFVGTTIPAGNGH